MQANGNELRQFIERIEVLEKERTELSELVKEVKAEAKGRGYDIAAINAILKKRKKSPDDLAEFEAIVDLYEAAIGAE